MQVELKCIAYAMCILLTYKQNLPETLKQISLLKQRRVLRLNRNRVLQEHIHSTLEWITYILVFRESFKIAERVLIWQRAVIIIQSAS